MKWKKEVIKGGERGGRRRGKKRRKKRPKCWDRNFYDLTVAVLTALASPINLSGSFSLT